MNFMFWNVMDIDDKGYITIEGTWDEEIAFGDFQELDEYDIANALSFWRQDHGVYWDGTFTITKNGVSTEYDGLHKFILKIISNQNPINFLSLFLVD